MVFGPLTAADDGGDDDLDPPLDDAAFAMDPGAISSLAAKYPDASAIRDSYEAGIARLKAQRTGLTGREKLAVALAGFAQPSQHGFRGAVANAASALVQQNALARKQDLAREALIAKYMTEEGPKLVSGAAAMAKANKPPDLTKDTDQRMRMGYARRMFPGKTDDEIAASNLLYDPKVDQQMIRIYGARASATAGEDVGDVETPVTPTLDAFLPAARKANPGVSDADLTAYYRKKYGGQ